MKSFHRGQRGERSAVQRSETLIPVVYLIYRLRICSVSVVVKRRGRSLYNSVVYCVVIRPRAGVLKTADPKDIKSCVSKQGLTIKERIFLHADCILFICLRSLVVVT